MNRAMSRRSRIGRAFASGPLGVLAVMAVCALPAPGARATSEQPAALVEQIDAKGVDLGFMDFVDAGTEIVPGDSLTLSYFQSCVLEEIKGGRVVVGERESTVSEGGSVSRRQVDCDGGGIVATERQSQKVAALVLRTSDEDCGEADPVMVDSTEPLFAFREPVRDLEVELRVPGYYEVHNLKVTGNHVDLADERLQLRPDGLYCATAGDMQRLFKVDRDATAEHSSAIGRLVAF
jgi:hypothetical protein